MTTNQQDDGSQYFSATFAIFPERLERQGRSFGLLLRDRRCNACWGDLVQLPDGGLSIPAKEHLERITTHCSQGQDFIMPGTPVMEAVFRLLLSHGSKPATLEAVQDGLQARWADGSTHWTPYPAKLYRMMARDVFYGIGEVSPPKQR